MRTLCFLLAMLSAAASAQPATGILVGRVTDAETGEALPGATAQIVGSTRGAAADVEGVFRFEAVPQGPVTLRVSFVGFREAVVEAVLASDTLRVEIELAFSPCLDDVSLSVVSRPRGSIDDLPGEGRRAYPWRTRPVVRQEAAPVSERVARSAAFEVGTDRGGRWRPAGLSAPAVYVDGVRDLSLDGLATGAVWFGEAHPRYVPAAYGGSAGGVVALSTGGGGGQVVFEGASARGPVAIVRPSLNVPLGPDECGVSGHWVIAAADLALGTQAEPGQGDGRARVGYTGAQGFKVVVDAATGLGPEAPAQGTARLVWIPEHHTLPQIAVAGGVVRDGAAPHRWSTLGAVRVGRTTYRGHSYGLDASTISTEAGAASSETSAVAGYVHLARDRYDDGWLPPLEAGLRVERFGVERAGERRVVWTVQPRARAKAHLGKDDRYLYTYGTVAAGAMPSGPARVARRSEVGGGLRLDTRTSAFDAWDGAVGYVRRIEGAGPSGTVRGADLDLSLRPGAPHVVDATLWARVRAEAGDARFARDRWMVGASVVADDKLFIPALAFLEGTYDLHLDVSAGLPAADGRRPRVVCLGGRLTLGPLYCPPIRLHVDAVVRGRDAVPCADPLGGSVVTDEACPTPAARVLLEVPF